MNTETNFECKGKNGKYDPNAGTHFKQGNGLCTQCGRDYELCLSTRHTETNECPITDPADVKDKHWCHKDCPCKVTETNEDWKELIREKAKKISCDEEEAELYVQDIIYIVSAKIRSLRQSDKELILGKMEEIEGLQTLITADGTQIISNDSDRSPYIKKSEALDTCKSIVEEVMK